MDKFLGGWIPDDDSCKFGSMSNLQICDIYNIGYYLFEKNERILFGEFRNLSLFLKLILIIIMQTIILIY